MKRKYELVYVVSPDATDAQIADLHAQVEAIAQRLGGVIEKTDNWGRRRLAYEIGPHKEGTYVLELIEGGGELMLHQSIRVRDLAVDPKWKAVTDGETMLVHVVMPKAEEVVAPAADAAAAPVAVAGTEPEVIKKGKTDKEEEAPKKDAPKK